MTSQNITKEYNLEVLRFLEQMRKNPKTFLNIVTLDNVIIYLDGFCNGLIGQLVKKAEEDEYIFYKTPDNLVKEYLVASYLIPESKRANVINPNNTMIMYFKNKYPKILEQVDAFLDIAYKCYTYEMAKDEQENRIEN